MAMKIALGFCIMTDHGSRITICRNTDRGIGEINNFYTVALAFLERDAPLPPPSPPPTPKKCNNEVRRKKLGHASRQYAPLFLKGKKNLENRAVWIDQNIVTVIYVTDQ